MAGGSLGTCRHCSNYRGSTSKQQRKPVSYSQRGAVYGPVVVRETGASVHGGVRKPDSVCVTFTQVDRAQGSQGGPEHGRIFSFDVF